MDIVDLLIHVSPLVSSSERQALEQQLRNIEGVIAPRFNKPGSHLLSIAFNPERVGSRRLLHAVRAAGYQASLVGL